MKIVNSKNAPQPKGHYSQAIIHNDVVYLSGILPVNKDTNEFFNGSIEEQCLIVFENLKAILNESGSCLEQVLNVTIYIPDISYWERINNLYSGFFIDNKPCRTIVPTTTLHYEAKLELNAIAYIK